MQMRHREGTEGVAGYKFMARSVSRSPAHNVFDEKDKDSGGAFRDRAGDALRVQAR